MSASTIAAIVASAASVIFVLAAIPALMALKRTITRFQAIADEVSGQLVPLVQEARSAVGQAAVDLDRVETLLTTAESVGATVDAASKLAFTVFSNPVIKAVAFGSGLARGTRSLARIRRARSGTNQ